MSTTETPPTTDAPEAGLPQPLRRPLRSRLSGGHVVMLVAGLTAMLLNYAALRAHDDRVPVAVAGRDLAAGETIGAGDLAFTDVRADGDVVATLLTPDRAEALTGHVTAIALPAGTLVRDGDLRAPAAPDGQRAMSIPIEPEHAVAGRLAAGDEVDVIEVRDGRARFLVAGAPVLHVAAGDARGLTGPRAFSVTIAVGDADALRLALAIREGHLEVVRATGASAPGLDRTARDGGEAAPAAAGEPAG